MKYLKNIKEEKIFKFSEFEPTKYNSNILINKIMEWLRAYFIDNKNVNEINISLQKFISETNINIDKLKTFINDQNKTNKIEAFEIKIDGDIIIFNNFKNNNNKMVWEVND